MADVTVTRHYNNPDYFNQQTNPGYVYGGGGEASERMFWSGSTANAIGTYGSPTTIIAESNLLYDDALATLYADAGGNLGKSTNPWITIYGYAMFGQYLHLGAEAWVTTDLYVGPTGPTHGSYGTGTHSILVGSPTLTENGQIEIIGNQTSVAKLGGVSFHNAAATQTDKIVAEIYAYRDTSDNTAALRFDVHDPTTGAKQIGYTLSNASHLWRVDGTETMQLNSVGFVPWADDDLYLGWTSLRWKGIYGILGDFSGDVTIGGVLNFNDTNTQIWEDGSSNLTFKDAVTGTKTLAELASGNTYTFSNGITELTGAVTLGGALSSAVEITGGNTYSFSFGSPPSNKLYTFNVLATDAISLNSDAYIHIQSVLLFEPSSVPSTPAEGMIYYDTTANTFYGRDDTAWVDLGNTASGMVYPGAGIALSTGSAWDTSITNNSANWNTAYGWGDHDGLYDTTGTASGLISTHESTYNHTNYNTAYSHSQIVTGNPHVIGYADISDFNTGVSTYETSHATVMVDTDFASQGIMLRGVSSGLYSTVIGSSAVDTIETTLTDDDTHLPTSGAVFGAIGAVSEMVYPGAGIALSTGSAWGTSITDNSSNWNTAYGWGDHAGLYNDYTHPNHSGHVTSVADGVQTLHLTAITGQNTATSLSSTDELLINDNNISLAKIDISVLQTYMQSNLTFTAAMVYPGAGIALSTGSAWGTSITDNSANWNTAYSHSQIVTGNPHVIGYGDISDFNTGVSSYETSHATVLVDADFSSQGIMLRWTASGVYAIMAGSAGIDTIETTLTDDDTHLPTSGAVYGAIGASSMVYPGAGIALSTGSAWGTSITNNSANWDTAYSHSQIVTGNPHVIGYADISDFNTGVSTYETSHSDVIVDGDFSANGIMIRTASGVYSVLTNSSSVDTVETTLTNDDTHLPTSGAVYGAISGVASSPLTTKGDLWGYSTVDARVPVGANGTYLKADSAEALGVSWEAYANTVYEVTLTDNTTTNIVVGDTTNNRAITVRYSMVRGTDYRSGSIDILNSGGTITDDGGSYMGDQSGITLDTDALTGDIRLKCTLTSTGNNATFEYVLIYPDYSTSASGGASYTHPNHSGQVTSVGDGVTTLTVSAITGQTAGTSVVDTDEFLYSDGGVIKRVDASVIKTYIGASSMVYPGAGIALSTGSAWGTSITNNSANWNTAYTHSQLTTGNPHVIGYADISDFNTGVSSYETSHSDVMVDGDFSSNGIMIRTAAGVYSVLTNSGSVDTVETTLTNDDTHLPTSGAVYGAIAGAGGMVYPGAGIAVSTGAAWGTSITNNSANWNTAYSHSTTTTGNPHSVAWTELTGARSGISLSGFNDDLTYNNYTHPNHSGQVTSTGDGAQVATVSIITDQTSLTSGLVSTDELILSDGGVLKRMDISVLEAYMQSELTFGGSSLWTDGGTYIYPTSGESVYPQSNKGADLGATGYFWDNAYVDRVYLFDSGNFISAGADNIYIGVNSSNIFQINHSWVVIYQDLLPGGTDKTLNLGGTSDWWANVYVDRLYIDNLNTYIDVSGSDMTFRDANNTTPVTLSALLGGGSGSLIPSVTGTYDLGDTTHYWRYAYVNRLYLDNTAYYLDVASPDMTFSSAATGTRKFTSLVHAVSDYHAGSTSTSETLIGSNTLITNGIYEGNLGERVIRVTINYVWTQDDAVTPSGVFRVKLGSTTLKSTTTVTSTYVVGTCIFYITPVSATQSHVHYTHMYNALQTDMSAQGAALITHGTGSGIYAYFDGAGDIDWDIKSCMIEVLG